MLIESIVVVKIKILNVRFDYILWINSGNKVLKVNILFFFNYGVLILKMVLNILLGVKNWINDSEIVIVLVIYGKKKMFCYIFLVYLW